MVNFFHPFLYKIPPDWLEILKLLLHFYSVLDVVLSQVNPHGGYGSYGMFVSILRVCNTEGIRILRLILVKKNPAVIV